MRANDAEQVGAVQPALTPGEWERRSGGVSVGDPHNVAYLHDTRLTADGMFEGRERHALAALALHGQPFGPKREWVAHLEHAKYGQPLPTSVAAAVYKFVVALLPPD